MGQDVKSLNDINENIIKPWESRLDDKTLLYWKLLSKKEQNEHLFTKSDLGKIFRELSKKILKRNIKANKKAKKLVTKDNRVKSGVSKLRTSDALKVIEKKLVNEKNEKWDYKKTDWDVT